MKKHGFFPAALANLVADEKAKTNYPNTPSEHCKIIIGWKSKSLCFIRDRNLQHRGIPFFKFHHLKDFSSRWPLKSINWIKSLFDITYISAYHPYGSRNPEQANVYTVYTHL